jgi:AraC family transcriptional regulator
MSEHARREQQSRRFRDALEDPVNRETGLRRYAEGAGATVADAVAGAGHDFLRGPTSELVIVAQRNRTCSSVKMDFGWGLKERFCANRQAMYVIPAYCEAMWRLDGSSACTYLALPWDDLLPVFAELDVANPAERMFYLSAKGFADPVAHTLISRLWQEVSSNGHSSLLISSYRLPIIHSLLLQQSAAPRQRAERGRLRRQQMQQVREYVHAYLAADIPVEAVSAAIGMSAFHFSRLFKNTTGQSPYQYILSARIERAKELLATTNHTVREIAGLVGFSRPSAFSRAFLRLTGSSAQRYREDQRDT